MSNEVDKQQQHRRASRTRKLPPEAEGQKEGRQRDLGQEMEIVAGWTTATTEIGIVSSVGLDGTLRAIAVA